MAEQLVCVLNQANLYSGCCELCGRKVSQLTRHHLIPQTRHKNRRNKREFSREYVREAIATLCQPCHKQLHALFSNKELERRLNTLERLRAEPLLIRFVDWIKNKPDGTTVPTASRSGG